MAVVLNPYLHFDGNAEEVLNFYKSVFGGEVLINRYGDNPGAMDHTDEKFKDLVMHGDLQGTDVRLMVSDSGPMGTPVAGSNFSMALTGGSEDEARLKDYFAKLSDGGKVSVPFEKAVWGDWFGMVDDKYGITWMVNISAQ